jgi:Tol biopolymer transport system component/predicted Ser/Thr protein kinase
MSLANGTKLGPYEIVAPLGAGGMGEVYRARDTRLGRDVAIKVLPSNLSSDAQRRERFEREARAISALNHPHICTLYDVGREREIDFLVMELVEGESLATRIEKGAMPAEQVLRLGSEIADALDKAHRLGITHRDLKPGNIMLTKSGIKLLDFGLAKFSAPAADPATSAETMLTTRLPGASAKPLTAEGSIIGTFQYMAPEQLEGAEADARSDIFSFGAVLYEMATGKKAFDGKTTASVIAAVLAAEPAPISSLQPMTPPALERLVKICLAKDPDERFQSAHDLSLQLKWISEAGSQAGVAAPVIAHRRSRERIAWALIGIVAGALIAAALAFALTRSYLNNQPKPSVMRFLVSLPPEDVRWGTMSLSPDGRLMAFVGVSNDGVGQLWLRPLDNVAARPLPGTEGARAPFWSPDGHYLAFFDAASLKKVAISGGTPQTLCNVVDAYGGSWNSEGLIIFGAGAAPLWRVSEAGGTPSPLNTLDRSLEELGHAYPWFLPDGRHFLYSSTRSTSIGKVWLCIGSLDSNETKCLLQADSPAVYAPPGDLLYVLGATLMAQPFDARHLAITGDAVPIAENVQSYSGVNILPGERRLPFSTSENGILAYVAAGSPAQTELQWFDRSGKKLGTPGQPAGYCCPVLSPDGTRLAVDILDPQLDTRDIWLFDLKRATASRFTFDPTDEISPLWSPDGGQILFTSTQTGHREIYQKAANGIGDSQLVFASKDQQKSVNDWSADGRFVVYDDTGSPATLWILPLFGDRKPFPFVQDAYSAREAFFSPNSRYIAYASNESGNYEIYVQTFPDRTGKWQVSTGGGTHPQWRRDGKELYFVSGSKLMAVDVDTAGSQFEAGIAKPLFDADFLSGSYSPAVYAPTADGQRFLAVIPVAQQAIPPITLVTNWPWDLKP